MQVNGTCHTSIPDFHFLFRKLGKVIIQNFSLPKHLRKYLNFHNIMIYVKEQMPMNEYTISSPYLGKWLFFSFWISKGSLSRYSLSRYLWKFWHFPHSQSFFSDWVFWKIHKIFQSHFCVLEENWPEIFITPSEPESLS